VQGQPKISSSAKEQSGLGIHYDLGEGHPLLGRRMPDLDLVTANGPLRVFALLHDARRCRCPEVALEEAEVRHQSCLACPTEISKLLLSLGAKCPRREPVKDAATYGRSGVRTRVTVRCPL
jgi:hypothetical protein